MATQRNGTVSANQLVPAAMVAELLPDVLDVLPNSGRHGDIRHSLHGFGSSYDAQQGYFILQGREE